MPSIPLPATAPRAATAAEGLAMVAQTLLAVRSTSDLGTACAIAGACAVHGLEASEFRVVRVDARSGSLRCLEESGIETAYLAEPDGPLERAVRTETSLFDDGRESDHPRETLLWLEPPVALATIALNAGGALQGFLLVGFPGPRRFDAVERLYLQSIGDVLALAFQREALRGELGEERVRVERFESRYSAGEETSASLMSIVAHEIRTPLTAIKAYTEALLDNLNNEQAPRQRFLGIISDECDRLTRLVSDILDLSKLEAGQRPLRLARFKLADLMNETLESLAPATVARRIALDVDVPEDVTPEADPDLLRRLLINLVGNAIKFSPAAGTVRIRARDEGEWWVGTIEDEGDGIPEDDLPHVFERFYRGRHASGSEVDGSGLGLAIARGIVELHGGQIRAEAREPHGARFRFSLPVRQLANANARRIARQVWSRPDLRQLFDHTVEMVAASMNAEIVSFMLVDPDRGDLFVAASRGLEGQNLLGRRTTLRAGVAGTVAASGKPLLVNNIETDRRFRRLNHPQYSTKSLLCVPLVVDGEVLGVVNVNNKTDGDAFDDDDLAVMSALIERVGSAVERACAHPESHRMVAESIEAVRSVTRLRQDGLLGGRDVVRLTRAIARELGMNDSDVDVTGYVASIHDVGMTHVPACAALPEPLDEESRRAVYAHPAVSVEILRPLEYLGTVRDLILSHHERWDGRGYPRGLSGEEIPLGARILAVVDAYDSMTRGRPYRPARSREAALAELRRECGRQFDSRVVTALETVLAHDARGAA